MTDLDSIEATRAALGGAAKISNGAGGFWGSGYVDGLHSAGD